MMKNQKSKVWRRYGAAIAAGTVMVLVTPQAGAETPEERCARETAAHNATMEALWRASHPGQEPGPGAWPPYVCVGGPEGNNDTGGQNTNPAPPAGGQQGATGGPTGGEEDSAPLYGRDHRWDEDTTGGHERTHQWDDSDGTGTQRTHQWDDSGRTPSQYEQDMQLGPLGDARRSTGQTGGSGQGDRRSAADSARSNVPTVPVWEEQVRGNDGQQRTVRVADLGNGVQAVVDDTGRGTGEVVRVDPATGEKSIEIHDDLAGESLVVDPSEEREEAAPASAAPGEAESTQTSAIPEAPVVPVEGETGDTRGDDGGEPVGPLGAVGAAIGGLGVLERRRRRDRSWQGDIDWGEGREQSLIVLEGPESPREYRYDLDVPPGGQVVENPDGSVDVLDAQGNVTKHVKAPWAYDAAGREVPTYFEVDPETGELVQVVDPERTTVLPIVADPDKRTMPEYESDDMSPSRAAQEKARREKEKHSATKPASDNPAKNPENMTKNPVTGSVTGN